MQGKVTCTDCQFYMKNGEWAFKKEEEKENLVLIHFFPIWFLDFYVCAKLIRSCISMKIGKKLYKNFIFVLHHCTVGTVLSSHAHLLVCMCICY